LTLATVAAKANRVDPDRNMHYRRAVHAGLVDSDPAAAFRYGHCREEGFGWWYHCPNNDGHYATYVPSYCMLRVCPDCGQYSAHLIQEKYRPVIEREAAKSHRKALKFVTLTTNIELADDIGPAVLQLLDWSRDLYRKLWGKEKGSGALATLETGEDGLKLHTHLILQGRFIKQEDLSKEWEKISGFPIVHITEISADKAVKEVLKYAVKFSNLNPEQLVSLHNALKGRRRVRSWGCFYNPDIEEETEERETHCPECAAQLRYTSEVVFEQWRANNAQLRLSQEMLTITRLNKSLLSLLHLTDANKFLGTGPPNEQISFVGSNPDQIDVLLDDALQHKRSKRGMQ